MWNKCLRYYNEQAATRAVVWAVTWAAWQ
jgi:hypothetical protein